MILDVCGWNQMGHSDWSVFVSWSTVRYQIISYHVLKFWALILNLINAMCEGGRGAPVYVPLSTRWIKITATVLHSAWFTKRTCYVKTRFRIRAYDLRANFKRAWTPPQLINHHHRPNVFSLLSEKVLGFLGTGLWIRICVLQSGSGSGVLVLNPDADPDPR
jgi:hypothetical protein